MLYHYATFPGTLIVTCTQELPSENDISKKVIQVNFEQPDDEGGFKEARYEIPGYRELWNEGFTPSETEANLEILKTNEELIIECSREEGRDLT
ncbi:hypothetical protein FOD75_11355 (plasmid) [Limosilactobacillus reuteri]|uniref:Uncharacterized protein n=1 Tax=Limosilactobacillus reuteri TaxID=1598 RepID=A0A517D8J4_LIMRT|nr:hypothetical protein [Limosilactobacillus reuteri]QDR73681.1 hypothetical protein FOD75_11355 [Limosilactobacillus reuteri]